MQTRMTGMENRGSGWKRIANASALSLQCSARERAPLVFKPCCDSQSKMRVLQLHPWMRGSNRICLTCFTFSSPGVKSMRSTALLVSFEERIA